MKYNGHYALVQVTAHFFNKGDEFSAEEVEGFYGEWEKNSEEIPKDIVDKRKEDWRNEMHQSTIWKANGGLCDSKAIEDFIMFEFQAIGDDCINWNSNCFDMEVDEAGLDFLLKDEDYADLKKIALELGMAKDTDVNNFLLLFEFTYSEYEDYYSGGTECDMEFCWYRITMSEIAHMVLNRKESSTEGLRKVEEKFIAVPLLEGMKKFEKKDCITIPDPWADKKIEAKEKEDGKKDI